MASVSTVFHNLIVFSTNLSLNIRQFSRNSLAAWGVDGPVLLELAEFPHLFGRIPSQVFFLNFDENS